MYEKENIDYEHQNRSINNVYAMLEGGLDECQSIATFAKLGRLGNAVTRLEVLDGAMRVALYAAEESGVVLVTHAAGMCVEDTAYCGDIEETHRTVVRIARHVDCEVTHDEFDVLD